MFFMVHREYFDRRATARSGDQPAQERRCLASARVGMPRVIIVAVKRTCARNGVGCVDHLEIWLYIPGAPIEVVRRNKTAPAGHRLLPRVPNGQRS